MNEHRQLGVLTFCNAEMLSSEHQMILSVVNGNKRFYISSAMSDDVGSSLM